MSMRKPTELEALELFAIGPDAIDLQEKRGQADLVRNTRLPIKGSDSKEAKESPVTWGANVDKLFREATLPDGWKKIATVHPMWSHLVDHKGCVRARMFYKAAFYDTDAHIDFSSRYYAMRHYNDDGSSMTFLVYDNGQGPEKKAIYADTPAFPNRETDRDAYYTAQTEAEAKAAAWLNERYPEHRNPNAYWDAPPAT